MLAGDFLPPETQTWLAVVLQLLLLSGAIGLVVTLLSDRAIRRTLKGHRRVFRALPPLPVEPGTPLPAISILKPVKGVDEGLAENLLSLMAQDYPDFEILVGAASSSDPALALVRRLSADHPAVRLRIIVCPEDGGLNPKVSILRTLSGFACSDLILISDSNVRVGPGYIAATARELRDPGVGLVTNPIAGTGEESLGARFEGLHLATYVARALSFASAYLGRSCVVGKSMMFRLSDLRRLGGWSEVRDVLAEDYALGHAFERAGFRVAVSPFVVFNFNQSWPVSRFVNRHLRWGQMRRRTSLLAYLLEPLFNPNALFTVAVLLAFGSGGGTARALLPWASAGVSMRLLADWRLLRRMRPCAPRLSFVLLGVPKDLLVLGLWLAAGFRRTVDWRGRRFIIGAGTRLEPIATPVSRMQPG